VSSVLRSRRVARTLALAAASASTALVGVVVTAESAQAYTCSWSSAYIDDGSASMSIRVGRYCSDGLSHVTGTIWDDKCDGRGARSEIRFYNGDNLVWYRREWPQASNGCGTSSTFSYGSTNQGPRIWASVWAANSTGGSSGDSTWV
jgi:hypothetical protein